MCVGGARAAEGGGWRGIEKEEQKVHFIHLFLFSSRSTLEMKYLLLNKGKNV